MDRAPLPPHERPWRHPSELGPPEHEPTSSSGRVLVVTTATLTLLLVGVLALTMSPGHGDHPLAVDATASTTSRLAALERPRLPMVTPLGDEGWAVTTSGAVGARAGLMAARLPSGDVVDVEIVQRDAESGVSLVSLPEVTHGYRLATERPEPSDLVVVHGDEPRTVPLVDVRSLDVADGTPVLDDTGDLIGICANLAGGVTVMTVSTMPGSAVTTPPSSSSSTTATSAPVATSVGSPATLATTVAPSTTGSASLPLPVSTTPAGSTTAATPAGVSGGGSSTTGPG